VGRREEGRENHLRAALMSRFGLCDCEASANRETCGMLDEDLDEDVEPVPPEVIERYLRERALRKHAARIAQARHLPETCIGFEARAVARVVTRNFDRRCRESPLAISRLDENLGEFQARRGRFFAAARSAPRRPFRGRTGEFRDWLRGPSPTPAAAVTPEPGDERLALRSTQIAVLGALSKGMAASITEVAKRLYMDRSTLSRSLSRLAKRGLVQVRASRHDGRARVAELTSKGREHLLAATGAWFFCQTAVSMAIGLEKYFEKRAGFAQFAERCLRLYDVERDERRLMRLGWASGG
jgi:DNA-binding MarR family transcriptional regulator